MWFQWHYLCLITFFKLFSNGHAATFLSTFPSATHRTPAEVPHNLASFMHYVVPLVHNCKHIDTDYSGMTKACYEVCHVCYCISLIVFAHHPFSAIGYSSLLGENNYDEYWWITLCERRMVCDFIFIGMIIPGTTDHHKLLCNSINTARY